MRHLALIPVLLAGCSTAPIAGMMDRIDKKHMKKAEERAYERRPPEAFDPNRGLEDAPPPPQDAEEYRPPSRTAPPPPPRPPAPPPPELDDSPPEPPPQSIPASRTKPIPPPAPPPPADERDDFR